MNKSGNRQTILRLKKNTISAMLFLLIGLSGHFALVNGQASSDVWTFKEVRVFRAMDGRYGDVVREHFDVKGGSVDINLSGNILDFCPGGTETLRFNWKFPDNISRLSRGGGFGVSIEAGQIGRNGTCQSQIAARSGIEARGCCEGIPFTDKDKEPGLLEYGRFSSTDTGRSAAHTDSGRKTSGFAKLKVQDWVLNPNKTLTLFEIYIGVPTNPGGGWVRYVYIYERGGKGNTDGDKTDSGTVNVSVENDTDRPGEDYSNFDLPRADAELCRSACAGDAKCKAYTYVKPGVQGSNARCWLKSRVPPAGRSNCCISGRKH